MRILFADDSMTAQNMGKKILTEAGYEVVAVSNGAAAVKKIAEQKPDIIILDIYMPGYTGLEVCDKVRGSAETLKTPVLLTVGKMEPYRPEDANRVKADGVIIKPFEASDLLAVIKKLEERVVPRSVPVTEQTIRLERPPELEDFPEPVSDNHREAHAEPGESTVQATVDVPDNMATAAAFSDLLGPEPNVTPFKAHTPAVELPVFPEPAAEAPSLTPEPAQHAAVNTASVPEFTTLAPEDSAIAPKTAPVPEWDPGASMSYTASDFNADFRASAATPAPAAANAGSEKAHFAANDSVLTEPVKEAGDHTTAASFPDTQPIPVFEEPETAAGVSSSSFATVEHSVPSQYTTEDTAEAENPASSKESGPSAAFAAATIAPPEPKPQPPSLADSNSPTNPAEFDSFSAKVEAQIRQIETIVSASEARYTEAEVKTPVDSPQSFGATEAASSEEDDFEARVQAAMSAYDRDTEEQIESGPPVDETETAVPQHPPAPESASQPASFDARYSFEYSPPIITSRTEHAVEPQGSTEAQVTVEEVARPIEASPARVEADLVNAESATPAPAKGRVSWHEDAPITSQQPVVSHLEESRVADQGQAEREAIAGELDAQIPAAATPAVADSGSDTQVIASVVSRVLERLKPHLIDEISRELRSKK